MIKTDRRSRLAVGSDGLLKVRIQDLNGEDIDAELYEFRVELYGEKEAKEKPRERELSDSGKYIISYDGQERTNNVVIDGELYFVIDKYALRPTHIYYSQYELHEIEEIESTMQRAYHGKLEASITYLNCPIDDSRSITMSTIAFKGSSYTLTAQDKEDIANSIDTNIPTKISELIDDSSFTTLPSVLEQVYSKSQTLTSSEIEALIPNISAWALSSTKPSYTASEVGAATEEYVDSAISTSLGAIQTIIVEINGEES